MQFLGGKLDHLLIGKLPDIVGVVAEVLYSDPHGLRVSDQIGAPVVEDLKTSGQNVGLLNVNPVVRNGFVRGFRVTDLQSLEQQTNGNEISILQTIADLENVV